jgi:RNA polymerase sigma factor (sigma-70 family)
MQEGVVGVLRALERYDPALGTPFWAYASWWVRQAMQQLVAELSRPVVLSDRALRQLAHVRNARHEHAREHGREPSLQELASASELTLDQLHSLLVAERDPRGLDEPVGGIPGAGTTFGELLSDPRAEDAYENLGLRLDAADLPRLLECLNERERMIVHARYGLGEEPQTLRELAGVLGISAERVRQLEQCALERMREAATAPCEPGAEGSERPHECGDAGREHHADDDRGAAPQRRAAHRNARRFRAHGQPVAVGEH